MDLTWTWSPFSRRCSGVSRATTAKFRPERRERRLFGTLRGRVHRSVRGAMGDVLPPPRSRQSPPQPGPHNTLCSPEQRTRPVCNALQGLVRSDPSSLPPPPALNAPPLEGAKVGIPHCLMPPVVPAVPAEDGPGHRRGVSWDRKFRPSGGWNARAASDLRQNTPEPLTSALPPSRLKRVILAPMTKRRVLAVRVYRRGRDRRCDARETHWLGSSGS